MNYIVVAERSGEAPWFLTKDHTWVTGLRMAEVEVFNSKGFAKAVAGAADRSLPTRNVKAKEVV